MRLLNIVVEECNMLSSRERCPFLVRVEVAETGLQGNDGRLYAAGVSGLGATVEEALSMSASATSSRASGSRHSEEQGYAPYKIPSELLHVPRSDLRPRKRTTPSNDAASPIATPESSAPPSHPVTTAATMTKKEPTLPRGGYQTDEYYPQNPDLIHSEPWDDVRQHDYRELHQELYAEPNFQQLPPQQFSDQR